MYDLVILEPVYYWHIKIYRQRATIILYMTTKNYGIDIMSKSLLKEFCPPMHTAYQS